MHKSTCTAGHGPRRDAGKEKFWRRMLRDFSASGQSVRVFCSEQELSEPSFYAWRRTLTRRDALARVAKPAAEAAPAFVPIRLVGTEGVPADAALIEIVLGGGQRIRLRPPVDRISLVEIVAALRSADAAEG
jgi:hypothetical protein